MYAQASNAPRLSQMAKMLCGANLKGTDRGSEPLDIKLIPRFWDMWPTSLVGARTGQDEIPTETIWEPGQKPV